MNWQPLHLRLLAGGLATLVAVLGISTSPAFGQSVDAAPAVPADIQVPPGNDLFFVGHAVGTQNYVCVSSGADFKYVLFTPRATLFGDDEQQLTGHFFSPNPAENGTIRATWQDSRDSSTVWGQAMQSSADPNFVAPGAIGWVLLKQVGAQSGPTGGDALSATTYIQRLNTSGGVAPSTGCSAARDVGNQAFIAYTADYFFYRNADSA